MYERKNMKFQLKTFFLDVPIQTGRIYDIFVPEKIQHDTAVFLIHGGGWRNGSRVLYHTPIMERLADMGYIVASTDYRLTVTPSEQLKDCRDAYMHFVNELRKMGRPVKVAAYGGSAGAHLCSLLGAAAPGTAGEDFPAGAEWIKPECMILAFCPASFVPWEEIFPHVWTSMEQAVGVPYEKNPEIYRKLSLDHHLHREMPRTFFVEAEWEALFWPHQKIALAKKMAEMNNNVIVKIYKNMEHGFLFNFDRPHQREAFDDLVKFIERERISGTIFES